jgi:hypothetical protein
MRTCKDCNLTATTEEELKSFVKNAQGLYGRKNLCKPCDIKKNTHIRKNYYVEKAYGITLKEYKKRMASSDKCEVCGSKEQLCYDHCHATMDFRGVLCNKCNRCIGQLGDTIESIEKVLFYLKEK